MHRITVWLLPPSGEESYRKLHQALVQTAKEFPQMVQGEDNLLVRFPSDLMKYGLGSQIDIEVVLIIQPIDQLDFPLETREVMANAFVRAVEALYPSVKVQCTVDLFIQTK